MSETLEENAEIGFGDLIFGLPTQIRVNIWKYLLDRDRKQLRLLGKLINDELNNFVGWKGKIDDNSGKKKKDKDKEPSSDNMAIRWALCAPLNSCNIVRWKFKFENEQLNPNLLETLKISFNVTSNVTNNLLQNCVHLKTLVWKLNSKIEPMNSRVSLPNLRSLIINQGNRGASAHNLESQVKNVSTLLDQFECRKLTSLQIELHNINRLLNPILKLVLNNESTLKHLRLTNMSSQYVAYPDLFGSPANMSSYEQKMVIALPRLRHTEIPLSPLPWERILAASTLTSGLVHLHLANLWDTSIEDFHKVIIRNERTLQSVHLSCNSSFGTDHMDASPFQNCNKLTHLTLQDDLKQFSDFYVVRPTSVLRNTLQLVNWDKLPQSLLVLNLVNITVRTGVELNRLVDHLQDLCELRIAFKNWIYYSDTDVANVPNQEIGPIDMIDLEHLENKIDKFRFIHLSDGKPCLTKMLMSVPQISDAIDIVHEEDGHCQSVFLSLNDDYDFPLPHDAFEVTSQNKTLP